MQATENIHHTTFGQYQPALKDGTNTSSFEWTNVAVYPNGMYN